MSEHNDREAAIALIGMAGRFPGADNLDQFWGNLVKGICSIRFLSVEELRASGIAESVIRNPQYVPALGLREDLDLFDPAFFGISPREAEILDPQHRLLLMCAWEALEHAGYDPKHYPGAIGVFAGAMANTYLQRNLLPNAAALKHVLRRQMIMGNDREFLSTFISYKLDLRGPSVNVQSACSTSLVAVHYACQALLNGECDMALAGGVALTVPAKKGYTYREGLIQSPDGHCRAFDAQAQGTVFGRGAGMVLLKRLDEAFTERDTIHAIVRGTAVNNDGSRKLSFSAPSVDGQAEAIAAAMAVGGVASSDISYLEAHGTGTILGDPVEISSLTRAFALEDTSRLCALGSVKTNIGHLDAAAGIAGLIKTVLCLKHRTLVPSLFYTQPNPRIDFEHSPFRVNTQTRPWTSEGPRFAGINSFGVGGTNAHVVLEEAPRYNSVLPTGLCLLPISASCPQVLARQCELLAQHLEQQPQLNLGDVAYTLALGRRALGYRVAPSCRSQEEAVLELRRLARSQPKPLERQPELFFLLPGQGHHLLNAGRQLYMEKGPFWTSINNSHQNLAKQGFDLLGLIYPNTTSDDMESERLIARTENIQPVLFAFTLALAEQLKHWGLCATGFLGHSLGELSAACLAGVFTKEEGLIFSLERGRLMADCPPGAMVAVASTFESVQPLLDPVLSLAAMNGPQRLTLSGSCDAIDRLCEQLVSKGIAHTRLGVDRAFHHPSMAIAARKFAALLSNYQLKSPNTPYLSSVTGTWIKDEQVKDPLFWAQQILEPVQFGQALEKASQTRACVLLELGSDCGLNRLAQSQYHMTAFSFFDTNLEWERNRCELLGKLWTNGIVPDWEAVYKHQNRWRVALPSQPFQLASYWIAAPCRQEVVAKPVKHSKKDDLSQWCYVPRWQEQELPSAPQASKHWLVFAPDGSLGDDIVAKLRQQSLTVVAVKPGLQYEHHGRDMRLRPGVISDYQVMLADLSFMGFKPDMIVHAWSLDPKAALQTILPDSWETCLEFRFYSLFFFLKVAAKSRILSDADHQQLLVLGEKTQITELGEQAHPLAAVSHGPIRVIAQEFPGLNCRHLDFDGQQAFSIVAALLKEASSREEAFHVAYRSGKRLQLGFTTQTLSAQVDTETLREGGTYLITGGLGGINLKVAAYLARQTKGNLILTSRAAFPGRELWVKLLADHDLEKEKLRQQIKDVMELEKLGAMITVKQADAGDQQAMRGLFEWIDSAYSSLHGVVNGAGLADGGMIYNRDRASIERIFAPKVLGSLILEQLVRPFNPDFVVHFGSLHSAVGGVGKLAHSAASAVLDLLALGSPLNQRCIAWDAWLEVGQAAKQTQETHKPIEHGLFSGISYVGEQRCYRLRLSANDDWVLSEHHVRGEAVLPGTAYVALLREALVLEDMMQVHLEDLMIHEPLIVPEAQSCPISIILEGSQYQGSFRIESGTKSICHVRGRYTRSNLRSHELALTEITDRLANFRKASGQRKSEAGFFVHGPRWHSLDWMHWSENESLSCLSLKDDFAHDLEIFGCHPALLDTALGLLARTQLKDPHLPFSFESIQLIAPMTQKIFAHARTRTRVGDQTLVQDMDLYDAKGLLFCAIKGFVLRRVHKRLARTALSCFQLTLNPGKLDSLAFREVLRDPVAAGQVEIEISASALNFKDVLKATGMLGLGASARNLGLECCGTIVALASDVVGFSIGQRVIGFTKTAMRPYVTLDCDRVFPCPTQLDQNQGASVLVAYLTAYQALFQVGRLRAGEKILIHAATGGVGLAALNLARHLGAEIYATAGSETKRAYLRLMGVTHIYDSRSTDYAAAIRAQTDGRGLDIVLNCLSGEHVQLGLELLAPFGRFLELGRRDIEAESPISLGNFRKHLTFSAITASPSMPGFRETVETLLVLIAKDQLKPLPVQLFPIEKVGEAVALLATAGHIGKVVVTFDSRDRVRPGRLPSIAINKRKGHGMTPAEGVEIFARVLAHPYRQVVISTRTLETVVARQDQRLRQNKPVRDNEHSETSLEQMLAQIWSEFLGLDQVDPHANFFDLGGDSLTAIQIVGQINRRFHADLSSYALLDHPTLSSLVQRLQASEPAARPGQLIHLNHPNSAKPRLYLLPPMEGDLFAYRAIAQRLESAFTVIGVHEQSQATGENQADNIESLSARHLALIRAEDPTGPYRLCGYSFGGLLALEIAAQLQLQDAAVEAVIMIDTFGPQQLTHAFTNNTDALAFLLAQDEDPQQLAQSLASMTPEMQAHAFAQKRGQRIEVSVLMRLLKIFQHNAMLMRQYDPPRVQARCYHIGARNQPAFFPKGAGAYWQQKLGPDLTCIEVEGSHMTILQSTEWMPLFQNLAKPS